MSDEDARKDLQNHLRERAGHAVHGWKVAINATGAQQRLGITQALAAPLWNVHSHESGARCTFGPERRIYLEAELALTLGADITAPLSLEALRETVVSYTPCLEIVDYALGKPDLATMLSHSFFHTGFVLGSATAARDFSPIARPFPRVLGPAGVVRSRADEGVPDDVVCALHTLTHWVLSAGGSLRKGQFVLCGSYVEPVPLPVGASLNVEYGAGFSAVSLTRT